MEEGSISLPLAGRTILVTRPAGQAAGLVEPLETLGATVFGLPAIEIRPPLDPGPLDEALKDLDRYDWIVVTSVNGVAAIRERAEALGVVQEVAKRRLAAVGPSTARAVREAFREPDLVPTEFVGVRVAEALGDVRGLRFLLARADIARQDLPECLREGGATVDDPAAYRIVRPETTGELPAACPDWIALTSSSAVLGTRDALEAAGKGSWMRAARLACIGPITAATVRELGYEVALMPSDYTIPALVEAIARTGLSLQPPLQNEPLEEEEIAGTPSLTFPLSARASLQGESSYV